MGPVGDREPVVAWSVSRQRQFRPTDATMTWLGSSRNSARGRSACESGVAAPGATGIRRPSSRLPAYGPGSGPWSCHAFLVGASTSPGDFLKTSPKRSSRRSSSAQPAEQGWACCRRLSGLAFSRVRAWLHAKLIWSCILAVFRHAECQAVGAAEDLVAESIQMSLADSWPYLLATSCWSLDDVHGSR